MLGPRSRATGALLATTAVALAGCGGGPVAVDVPPGLSAGDAAACRQLVERLPDTLGGQQRREVEPEGAPAAAWGEDDPIVLTCGADRPPEFTRASACMTADGIGWFAPDDAVQDMGSSEDAGPVTLTAMSVTPYVALRVPSQYRPPADELTELTAAVGPMRPGRFC